MTNEYYIQNGITGNALAWWAKGSAGYTTDIDNAERFSAADAQRQVDCRPDEDRAYPCDLIDALEAPARKTIIDCQYVKRDLALKPTHQQDKQPVEG